MLRESNVCTLYIGVKPNAGEKSDGNNRLLVRTYRRRLKSILDGNDDFNSLTNYYVHKYLNNRPVITDQLIDAIEMAFLLPNKSNYEFEDADAVRRFLAEHKGRQCYLIEY